jgi:hypothetical protein
MKTLSFAIAMMVGFSAAASAHISDDEKQIEAIYGKPAKILEEKASVRKVAYAVGGVAVVVDFVNGISRREGFAKRDTSMLKDDEIQQILKVSAAQNTTWKEQPGKAGDRTWQRSDNKAIAIFPARGTFLYVQDPSYVPAEDNP